MHLNVSGSWIWWTDVLLKTRPGCTDLACFLENMTSRACLLTSGLNDIFHLCEHWDIFCRSLFSNSAEVLLLCTTENREVSSAKSWIAVDSVFSDKSFMYVRKRSGPRIDPCGTHAFTGNHSEVWPLSKALSNLLKSSEKALVKNLKLPLISAYKLNESNNNGLYQKIFAQDKCAFLEAHSHNSGLTLRMFFLILLNVRD